MLPPVVALACGPPAAPAGDVAASVEVLAAPVPDVVAVVVLVASTGVLADVVLVVEPAAGGAVDAPP
jgi:hypothetical protein